MSDRDSFADWLMYTHISRPPDAHDQARLERELRQLEDWLVLPPSGRPRPIPQVRGAMWGGSARLAQTQIGRVQQLYRRLVLASGSGKSRAETQLLNLLAYTLDPTNIAFFTELLDLAPPRDMLSTRRRELALAALALLVYRRDDADALAALVAATGHANPSVRALALHYLRQIHLGADEFDPAELPEPEPLGNGANLQWLIDFALDDAEAAVEDEPELEDALDDDRPPPEPIELRRPLTPELIAHLTTIGAHDPAFEPRFKARELLLGAGEPALFDNPAGMYVFKVALRRLKGMHRTIAAHSTDTLHDLHIAIQQAINWDDDHLYSFFLNNKLYDDRYRFSSPWDRDSPPWADEMPIGALGLTPKHKFTYYFDYGDSHEFEIQVLAIEPQATPGDYPRVVESHGAAPRQYPYSDEDEWDDEDDELGDASEATGEGI